MSGNGAIPPDATWSPGPEIRLEYSAKKAGSHRSKSILRLRETILYLAGIYPLEQQGMLLLGARTGAGSESVRKGYETAKYVLRELFEHHCGAIEFGSFNIHIHLYVVTKKDIRTGFHFMAYTQYVAGKRGLWKGLMTPAEESLHLNRLLQSFNPNDELQRIVKRLNSLIDGYGFLPVRVQDLAPLMGESAAAAKYITKQLSKRSSDFPGYVKGTHLPILPLDTPRMHKGPFSWRSGSAADFRKKVATVAGYLEVDYDGLVILFGKRNWMKRIGALISAMEQRNPDWPDYVQPNFDAAAACREEVRRWKAEEEAIKRSSGWYEP
jgi:hypothetical protein